jgi:hypothetical protein
MKARRLLLRAASGLTDDRSKRTQHQRLWTVMFGVAAPAAAHKEEGKKGTEAGKKGTEAGKKVPLGKMAGVIQKILL